MEIYSKGSLNASLGTRFEIDGDARLVSLGGTNALRLAAHTSFKARNLKVVGSREVRLLENSSVEVSGNLEIESRGSAVSNRVFLLGAKLNGTNISVKGGNQFTSNDTSALSSGTLTINASSCSMDTNSRLEGTTTSGTCLSKDNINSAPVAAIGNSSFSGNAPLEVVLNASGSSDGDGSIASYNWNFSDGTSLTGFKGNSNL